METVIIESREDLHQVLNRVNSMRSDAAQLKESCDYLMKIAEAWAKAHPEEAFQGEKKTADETAEVKYWLETAERALRLQKDVTEEEAVKLLGADPACERFVKKTYDSAALKEEFGGSKASRLKIKQYGFQFTEPQPHLKVAAL